MRPPLRYVDANIMLGQDGEAAALYRLPSVSYPFLPMRDKLKWRKLLSRLAHTLQADFTLWRVERTWQVEDYVAENKGLLEAHWGDAREWTRYLRAGERRMAGMSSHAPEVYLAVSLKPPRRGGFLDSFRGSTGETSRLITELFGVGAPRPVTAREMDLLHKQEAKVLTKLQQLFVGPREATTEELQWLFARSGTRGVREPLLDRNWKPDALRIDGAGAYRPNGAEFIRLVNAALAEQSGILRVDYDGTSSYQATICLGAVPEELPFPGVQAELLYAPIEMMHFPVDVVLHCTYILNRKARSDAHKKVMDADNNYTEEMSGHHGASWRTEENRAIARELEDELSGSENPPLLKCRTSFILGADSREEAESRAEQLIEQYGSGFALYKPTGLQEQLWYDHLPRADGGRVRDYEGVWTIRQFGAAMPIATQEVSTRTGAYVGYTTSGGHRPVFYDPTHASRHNRPPGMVVAGTLGSGKTMSCQTLAYAAHKRGSLVITVDPKPDHRLHELEDFDMEVVELSGNSRYKGLLDPLRFADPSMREDLTCSYLMEIIRRDEWGTSIRRAVKQVIEGPDPRLERVVDALLKATDHQTDREAGRDLEVWATSTGITQLAFGDGSSIADLKNADGITFRFPEGGGLTLPAPSTPRDQYSQSERLVVAMLTLVAAFSTQLACDASRHAFVLLDEAWALYRSATGRSLVDRLLRLGRSQQATLCLSTQSTRDLQDEEGALANLVGTYMIFGSESVGEARAGLNLIGLDHDDDTLVERVNSYEKGLCLMRDTYGRVAEVQIDPGTLLTRLDTTAGALIEVA